MTNNAELKVEVRAIRSDQSTVWIVKGHQSFRLDYRASRQECLWYANTLREVLGIPKLNPHARKVVT
jgi:hypothetical protein